MVSISGPGKTRKLISRVSRLNKVVKLKTLSSLIKG